MFSRKIRLEVLQWKWGKKGGGVDSCQKYSEDPWDTEVNNEINLSCKTRCEITLGPKIKCLDFYAVNESVEIC